VKVTEFIDNKINRLPKGFVFTYDHFMKEVNSREAVIKALNRMVSKGKLAKLSKGRYYKPERSVFGVLEPEQYQIVKDLIEKDSKPIGYVTGYGIYNSLGLTTQISSVIQIGRSTPRPSLKRGRYRISFVTQKNRITKENIPLLQILDAVKYIKKIPDTTVAKASVRLISIIEGLDVKDQNRIVRLAKKYPASTRALLGAILEYILGNQNRELMNTLNPITKYNINVDSRILPTKSNWNIV